MPPSPRVPPPEHVAAFFETSASFVDRVVPFVVDGLAAGETVIAIATSAHWNALAARLEADGVAYGHAAREGRLILVDAETILEQITIDGRVSAEAFASVVMPLLSSAPACRIYGELVSLLTERGDVDSAVAIETVGQEVAHTLRIPILCGYHTARGFRPTAADVARLAQAHDRTSVDGSRADGDAGAPVHRPLILLADDYSDALDMYGEYLRFSGYDVVLAADGEEAVRLAREHEPDIVLMDVRMPRMTGTAALKALREEERFRSVPILALTAHALESEREAILADGFDAVISKPCLPNELVTTVRERLSRQSSGVK